MSLKKFESQKENSRKVYHNSTKSTMMFENEKCSFELALLATNLDCSLRLTANWKSKAGAKVSYDYVIIGSVLRKIIYIPSPKNLFILNYGEVNLFC